MLRFSDVVATCISMVVLAQLLKNTHMKNTRPSMIALRVPFSAMCVHLAFYRIYIPLDAHVGGITPMIRISMTTIQHTIRIHI